MGVRVGPDGTAETKVWHPLPGTSGGIPPQDGDQVRTPASTKRHTRSALMAPPPPSPAGPSGAPVARATPGGSGKRAPRPLCSAGVWRVLTTSDAGNVPQGQRAPDYCCAAHRRCPACPGIVPGVSGIHRLRSVQWVFRLPRPCCGAYRQCFAVGVRLFVLPRPRSGAHRPWIGSALQCSAVQGRGGGLGGGGIRGTPTRQHRKMIATTRGETLFFLFGLISEPALVLRLALYQLWRGSQSFGGGGGLEPKKTKTLYQK